MRTKEESKYKESELYNGTLIWRSVLNQMHSYAIEDLKEGENPFAKTVKENIERIWNELQHLPNAYTESDLVSFGNFLLADRGEGNYLMSKKYVTHADLDNWKNEKK